MSKIDINKVFVRRQGNMPPIREVKLNEDDLKLSYWQREAECQKNWCEHYKQLSERYKQAIEEIEKISKEAGSTEYITFPDFDLKINAKMLMGQFNGYLEQIIQKCEEVRK